MSKAPAVLLLSLALAGCAAAPQARLTSDPAVSPARYAWDGARWRCGADWVVCKPEALAARFGAAPGLGDVVAGNAFEAYGDRLLPGWPRQAAAPGAAALLRLAPTLWVDGQAVPAAEALPRYIRDKVAKTTEERAREKAAALAGSPTAPSPSP